MHYLKCMTSRCSNLKSPADPAVAVSASASHIPGTVAAGFGGLEEETAPMSVTRIITHPDPECRENLAAEATERPPVASVEFLFMMEVAKDQGHLSKAGHANLLDVLEREALL